MEPTYFSFLLYVLGTYGLSFLLADAHIFGCDAEEYVNLRKAGLASEISKKGMVNLRPHLLRFRFFRKLFTCYFCLGAWCGPAMHVLLINFYDTNYWLYHEQTLSMYSLALLLNVLIGAPLNYGTNLVFRRLES